MESLTIKLDEQMLKKIDVIVKENNYGTRTEFVRSTLREKMTQLEKDNTIREFMKFKGILKRKVTDKDLRKTREEVSEELLREYGLK